MAERRSLEPWPIALALALAFMVCVSVSFYCVAASHPDPVLTQQPRPGVEH